MAKVVMRKAQLEPRSSDIDISNEDCLKISLFDQLSRKPNLDKFPGSWKLRYYKKGEMICRQGEAGWTAFYILTSADALAIRTQQLESATRDNEKRNLEYEVARLRQRVEQLKQVPEEDELHAAVTVYLAVARNNKKDGRSGLKKLLNPRPPQANKGGAFKNEANKTVFIPIDGPVTVSYDSLRATINEGELFGEMSCLYRTPRSATIVARHDCLMIEMLRNILDQIQKDKKYKERADEIFKKRALEIQIRKLSVFSDLTDDEYKEIQENVELVSYEPGQLICDEFERSDSLYIVRSGLVKVIKNVSWLLSLKDIQSWRELAKCLIEAANAVHSQTGSRSASTSGSRAPSSDPLQQARYKILSLLPERSRRLLQQVVNTGQFSGPEQAEVLYAFNDIIKTPNLLDAPEFEGVRTSGPFTTRAKNLLEIREGLVKKKKELPDAELRRCNRLFLDAVFPNMIEPRWNKEVPLPADGSTGPEYILSYLSKGDYFGEIGLMQGRPRSATCVAYGHPNDYGQVELVRLPDRVFWKLLRSSAPLRERVRKQVSELSAQTMKRLLTPVWDETNQVQISDQFESLGLIQGQKLMLIDLDRCTRCDECVKACVNTHDDGRSRLFLDGPRFGKYLIPTTCRACLDPVCMIGCPVGSIHRGDNRQMIIEDWCIGCKLCADNCPYGSIQMHDLGIIPGNARGWRYTLAEGVSGDGWLKPGYRDSDWLVGESPFALDRETRDELLSLRNESFHGEEFTVLFRYAFHLEPELAKGDVDMKMEIITQGTAMNAWINGQPVTPDGKPRRGKHEYTLPQPLTINGTPTEQMLKLYKGTNVLGVQVTVGSNGLQRDETLMEARLDEIRRPDVPEGKADEKVADEITEKLVTDLAVVCDMCSNQYGQRPACVTACPHDAAMRVDARTNFPTR